MWRHWIRFDMACMLGAPRVDLRPDAEARAAAAGEGILLLLVVVLDDPPRFFSVFFRGQKMCLYFLPFFFGVFSPSSPFLKFFPLLLFFPKVCLFRTCYFKNGTLALRHHEECDMQARSKKLRCLAENHDN